MSGTTSGLDLDAITDEMVERAAIALYEHGRDDEHRDAYYDWPNIDRAYDWDGDDDDLPEGELRPAGEWLRDRIRAEVRVVLEAALGGSS